ncbi:MAG: DUF1259 domain-containing protein [Candidatus Saccharibacteria bacterium]
MRKLMVFFLLTVMSIYYCQAQQNDWSSVEKVFGKKGTVSNGVFKITFPRSDLKVTIDGFTVDPGLALTSWIGIVSADSHSMNVKGNSMAMGDIVMTDKEVAAVIQKLVSLNISVTAIHNHLIGESPTIKYLHFSGQGNAEKLAESLRTVLSLTGTPMGTPQNKAVADTPDWSKVETILGTTGKKNGKLLQYAFPRNEKLTDNGMDMPPAIGMATSVNFQADGQKAAITGDFVLLAKEVNPVIKALTDNNIAVTAIHNHMLYDEPRLFMLHFWAVDNQEKLATGIKAALDQTNSKR